MQNLLQEIRNCKICKAFLPNAPKPIIQANWQSKIIIIGQAPGQKVQNSGIPWDDASGDNLRKWLGVQKQQFYNPNLFALMPMGFCYPGTGKSGDLPPRPECAPYWHSKVLAQIKQPKLIVLIGQYAQKYYLADKAKSTLTETVQNFKTNLPHYFPLPHPSPRNNIWQKKNPWFQIEVLPFLYNKVIEIL